MRTRKGISAVVVLLLASIAGVGSAEYLPWQDMEDANEPNYVEGELLVRFAPKQDAMIPTRVERRAILNALGGARETGSYWLVPGLTVVKLPDGATVEQSLAKFNASRRHSSSTESLETTWTCLLPTGRRRMPISPPIVRGMTNV